MLISMDFPSSIDSHIYSLTHSPTNILFPNLLCDKHSVRKNGYNGKPTYTCLLVLWFFSLLGRNTSVKFISKHTTRKKMFWCIKAWLQESLGKDFMSWNQTNNKELTRWYGWRRTSKREGTVCPHKAASLDQGTKIFMGS